MKKLFLLKTCLSLCFFMISCSNDNPDNNEIVNQTFLPKEIKYFWIDSNKDDKIYKFEYDGRKIKKIKCSIQTINSTTDVLEWKHYEYLFQYTNDLITKIKKVELSSGTIEEVDYIYDSTARLIKCVNGIYETVYTYPNANGIAINVKTTINGEFYKETNIALDNAGNLKSLNYDYMGFSPTGLALYNGYLISGSQLGSSILYDSKNCYFKNVIGLDKLIDTLNFNGFDFENSSAFFFEKNNFLERLYGGRNSHMYYSGCRLATITYINDFPEKIIYGTGIQYRPFYQMMITYY
jgi:hypothetical protein